MAQTQVLYPVGRLSSCLPGSKREPEKTCMIKSLFQGHCGLSGAAPQRERGPCASLWERRGSSSAPAEAERQPWSPQPWFPQPLGAVLWASGQPGADVDARTSAAGLGKAVVCPQAGSVTRVSTAVVQFSEPKASLAKSPLGSGPGKARGILGITVDTTAM